MKKIKLLITAFALLGASQTWAQTDVTSTYLTNADFEKSTPIDNHLCGYGKDMGKNSTTYYGLQDITGWNKVILKGASDEGFEGSAMGGAVFAYGSEWQMKGNNTTAPAASPNGEATNALGFFAVWGCGGYYYQNVTLSAGKYTITVPIYNQSGTQANTTYTGFFPNSGINRTVAINPTVGQWVNQTTTFTLTEDTPGQIRIGYQSTGNGSGANPHIFIDCVKIEFTASVVKDVLETAITAATKANETLNNSELAAAITDAQTVFNNENATQDQVNAAAATLNAATELAMSAAGDVTDIFLTNAGFESCTETTTNAAAGSNAAPLDIAGSWTQASSAAWSSSAVVAYGGSGQVNGASAPATDNAGNGGKTLGVSVGWSGTVTYQSEEITLAAGVYTLKVNAYNNLSGVTQFKSQFGFIPNEGNSTLSTKTSFAYATWVTDEVTFTLNAATKGKIQIGGTAISGGSGSNAKVFFDNITVNYKSFLAGAKEAYDNAVLAAEEAKTNNPNVTGEELTALNSELGKAEPTTVDGYNAATEAIQNATTTLIAAASSYNALVSINNMITATGSLKYADAEKKPAATVTATSAAEAATKTASQTTALRAYYESHALAEGVVGAVNMTSSITDANNPANNNGWTCTGNMNKPASNESWTDADGTNTHSYFDGGNWNGTSWTTTMEQNIQIPAGKYLLTAKGRAATNTTLTLSACGESVELPHVGSTGNVFDRGWGDGSVEFTTDGTGATILVTATAEPAHEWFSIGDFRLVCLESEKITISEEATTKPQPGLFTDVTLNRTLSKDNWNTFSVPFDAEIPDGWTVMEFNNAENNVISFSTASSLVAGKPYLVKPENDVKNPVFENVVVESIDGQTVGEGDYKFVAQIYNKELSTDGTVAYLATNGMVKKLTSGGIKGLRAYFTIPANVPEARIAFIDYDGDTTGISEKTMKVNEGIIYDLNGRRVENMGKGIYVVNGKKIVK